MKEAFEEMAWATRTVIGAMKDNFVELVDTIRSEVNEAFANHTTVVGDVTDAYREGKGSVDEYGEAHKNVIPQLEQETTAMWGLWEAERNARIQIRKTTEDVKEQEKTMFDAFHATELYNHEAKKLGITQDYLADGLREANAVLENQNKLLAEAATPALTQFGEDLASVALGAKSMGSALKDLAKNMISQLLIAIGKQLVAMAVLYTLALQFGKAAAALVGGLAAIAAGHLVAASMQQGGEVKALQTGGGGFGDHVPAVLEPGEIVIDKFTAQKNAAGIGAMRSGEGGGNQTINLVLDGRVLSTWIHKSTTNKQTLISQKAVVA